MSEQSGVFLQRNRWSRWVLVCTLILTAALAIAAVSPSSAAAYTRHTQAGGDTQVNIDNGTSLGRVPETAIGINNAVWDGNLLNSDVPGLMRQDGVKVMRYPGGSTSDVYHWQSNSVVPNQSFANPNNTFDAFMGVAQATGAQPMITINYGSGTPQEAAGWVQYANKGGPGYSGPVPTYAGGSSTGHNYGIKYWEIGNELYGNGTYGADWEYDLNPKGPTAYANNVVAYSQAMKAVDPSVKIGVVLTSPGNWPDNQTSSLSPQPWNDTVLPIACSSIDFVIAHWYSQGPTGESDAGLLGAPENGESTSVSFTPSIPTMVSTLRSKINQDCGAHASAVQIMVTETNSVSYNVGKQTVGLVNALFLADNYMTWLENGVANVDWWDMHNGITTGNNNSSSLYGTANYGDYGVLSSGNSANGISEPPADTPFPPYYGLQMVSKLARPGGQMLSTSSDQSLVVVHAVRQANGKIAVMMINKDPSASHFVKLSWSDYVPGEDPVAYFYGENSTSITTIQEHGLLPDYAQSLPPYSVTTLVVSPRIFQPN